MSHRSAVLISLALTALIGLAIVGNRDRLMGAESTQVAPTPTASPDTSRTDSFEKSDARIVEIELPSTSDTPNLTNSDRAEEWEDDDHGDDNHEDEDHDDEEEHEDDDRYEDDDD